MESQPLGTLEPDPAHPDHLWIQLSLLLVGAGVGLFLVAGQGCGHGGSQVTACKSNCKNVATALELYASDNQGQYPPRLQPYLLDGNYLKAIPTCPAAGQVTYGGYLTNRKRDRFHFSCQGNHHARAYLGFQRPSVGYPGYSSEEGLLDRP